MSSNPMTDTLEALADRMAANMPADQGDAVDYILAALKSVRDAASQTEQQLESYQDLCHSLERKIENVRCLCTPHTPKRYDVAEMVRRALKSVQNSLPSSPAPPTVEPADANRDRDLPQVGGEMMDRSIADHERACRVLIGDEQRRLSPDNHMIATLCESVRMGREYVRHMRETVIAALPICGTNTERKGSEGLPDSRRGECTGPLPGRNVTVVQTGDKTLFVTNQISPVQREAKKEFE